MTKVISISDEAYEELRRMKDGMSFSEVIVTITKERKKSNLLNFVGILSDEKAKAMKKEIEEDRKKISRRML